MMDWKEKRKQIDKELKTKVVPILRQKGFTGTYPHFRRITEKKIDVLAFQFSQWGPQFYVEIAVASSKGVTLLDGKHFPPDIIKHNHCGQRARIGDNPFDFENEQFDLVVDKVITSLTEGEEWWIRN
jgi:hypothetical protein